MAKEESVMMERKPSARILIADDHKLLSDACKSALEPEYEVVDIVTDGQSLVKQAYALKPDIIILDITMPNLNGFEAAKQIKQAMPRVKLVFLTMSLRAESAAEAFRRGASAYVLKHSGMEELLKALRKVLRGESYLSPMITRETVTYLLSNRPGEKEITIRQSEILQLLVEGKSMKEVGSALNVRSGTVAFHKYRMMDRLGIKTNAELLSYALKHHLVVGE